MEQKVTLVINRICPFAHRAYITAIEKKIPFELKEVKLRNKEPEFTELYRKSYAHEPNSTGKVPILIHGDKYLAESDLITWYLAETFSTGTQLIPQNTYLRAKVRYFSHTYPSKFFMAYYGFINFKNKTQEQKKAIFDKLNKILEELEEQIQGPYIFGQEFTIADILLWPWFDRWSAIEYHLGVTLDKKFQRVWKWVQTMKQRQSIKATTEPRQLFNFGYRDYFA